jgi:hypothetical protein
LRPSLYYKGVKQQQHHLLCPRRTTLFPSRSLFFQAMHSLQHCLVFVYIDIPFFRCAIQLRLWQITFFLLLFSLVRITERQSWKACGSSRRWKAFFLVLFGLIIQGLNNAVTNFSFCEKDPRRFGGEITNNMVLSGTFGSNLVLRFQTSTQARDHQS